MGRTVRLSHCSPVRTDLFLPLPLEGCARPKANGRGDALSDELPLAVSEELARAQGSGWKPAVPGSSLRFRFCGPG